MSYAAHRLHAGERIWPEANCYVDLWIELLHDRGLEPLAATAFALTADFEGDQWTFFKPPLADLGVLYGVEIEELNVWRSLVDHLAVQLARGRNVIVEVDSYFLPDTAGTTYHEAHGKTALAVREIDVAAQTLAYFHGAGLHRLSGADFPGAFRLADPALPPYVELVKWRRAPLTGAARADAAWALMRAHTRRIPDDNPVAALQARFAADVTWLHGEPPASFHAYAFAMLRPLGAAAELAALGLQWLAGEGAPPSGVDGAAVATAATELLGLAAAAKTLQFKLARAVNGKRALDGAALQPLVDGWARAIAALRSTLG